MQENRVEVGGYNEVPDALRDLVTQSKRIGYDETVINQRLYEVFQSTEPQALGGVLQNIKAVKSAVEMQGMRNANVKNCVALA